MRYLLGIIFAFILMTSCAPRYEVDTKELDTEEIVWLVQRAATKFKHEHTLRHEHSRVLFDLSGFTRLGIQFSTQDILEVNEARGLLVDFVEFILGEINRDPLLCGQLAAYPFNEERLDVVILCESLYQQYVDPFYIGCIKLKRGYSYFYAADAADQNLYSWHSRVEPYYKSREFIMLERAAEKEYQKEHAPKDKRIPDEYYPKD